MVIDAKSSALPPPEAEIAPPPDARPGVPATVARRLRGRRAAWVAPIALGVGLLLFWEFLARVVRVSPLFLPTPEAVVAAFWASARDGTLLAAVLYGGARLVERRVSYLEER